MRHVTLPDGTALPALGQGTWRLGEDPARRRQEVASLREGIERGLAVLDTAEMYAEGESERVVGEALQGLRDRAFVVSKFFPHNATRRGLPLACERSLARLGIERLDLYLLHWRGGVPLEETAEALERLVAQGKVARWGVSNLDVADLEELGPALARCATDQVLLSLEHRGAGFDLLPFCRARGIPVMAYSPLGQGGRLLANRRLGALAAARGLSAAQMALAWVLDQDGVLAIPKAADPAHLRANAAAAEVELTPADRAALDAIFSPPTRKRPLEMI